MKSIHSLTVQ